MKKPWKSFKQLRGCHVVTAIFFLCLALPSPDDLSRLSGNTRREYLRRGRILQPVHTPSLSVLMGPSSNVSAPPDAEVECHYVEEPIEAGATPKFKCRLMDSGEIVRVKFSRRETYAEVAGTRLLWSLGFFADEVFPVKLRCYGCPALDPSKPEGQERMERLISDAIIERNFPGKELEQFPDQGWRWSELRYVDPIPGGASLAEVDAFKLLAVFIQHGDSKPSQQRLGCYSQDLVWQNGHPICRRPVLMMQDLGATFGMSTNRIGGFSAMYYKGWERMKIWDTAKEEQVLKETGARKCFGQLRSPFKNGLISPEIHEEGRQLLVSLLNRLSDQQIRELFQAARIDMAEEIVIKNGKSVPVTIEDWVAAFKEKRAQIVSRTCASSSQ